MLNKKLNIYIIAILILTGTNFIFSESNNINNNINKILDNLADRMYCISETSGNKNDIEKELTEATEKLTEIFKTIKPEDIDLNPETGLEIFLKAVSYGNKEIINLFINAGFNINTTNYSNQTPAMCAAFHGNIEALQILIDKNADLTIKDKYDRTAFDCCHMIKFMTENIFWALPKNINC